MSSESGAIPVWQADFLERHRLAPDYLDTAGRWFEPLAHDLAGRARRADGPLRVAVNGSQGSGKSTVCAYLVETLRHTQGLHAVTLSLDDFYLTRNERASLAEAVHPLLATRGVPGTHDTTLLRDCWSRLAGRQPGVQPVPIFDKARDDRCPDSDWPEVALPLDLLFLEGWCLGARGETPSRLAEPVNELERLEDPEGRWRRYVDDCLRRDYLPLWEAFDCWVMLAAPDFDCVLDWRREQEAKLALAHQGEGSGIMDSAQLRRFVSFFERYTRQCLRELPARVDVLFELDRQRAITACRGL